MLKISQRAVFMRQSFCTPTEVNVQTQQYVDRSLNYIGIPTSSTSPSTWSTRKTAITASESQSGSTYVKVLNKVVKTGSKRHNLKVTNTTKKAWNNKFMTDYLGISVTEEVARSFTLYVTDDSGQAIDWTGYVSFWDLDWGGTVDYKEQISIPTSSIVEKVRQGSKVTTTTNGSMTEIRGTSCSTDEKAPRDYGDEGIVLKIHIPTSGMALQTKSSKGAYIKYAMLSEIMNLANLKDGTSGWETYGS